MRHTVYNVQRDFIIYFPYFFFFFYYKVVFINVRLIL